MRADDDTHLAMRSAHILGEASAAWKALTEYDQRTQSGEDVGIWLVGHTWVVGPRPADRPKAEAD